MKKWIGLLLVFALVCAGLTFASAEQFYQMGDKMDDFTVILSDGTETSLYGLLKEKKAVLINFWASWCSPCKREFPALEQAYAAMSDQIGVIALSCEAADTDEIVLALKEELGLSALPMGLDTGLASRFQLEGYPTSVIVDRNGVICFLEAGSIPDKDKFIRLFSLFTGDDYAGPIAVTEIPAAVSTVAYPAAEAISAALQITDERIAVTIPQDEAAWPFVPANACVEAANGGMKDSKALLTAEVTAQAGEALAFAYAISCPAALDSLTVTIDGKLAKYYGGYVDWTADYAAFESDGAHTVEIAYTRNAASTADETSAMLRGLHLLSSEEVAALDAQAPVKPKILSGVECDVQPLDGQFKPILMTETMSGSEPSTQTLVIVEGGKLTLRVTIGTDVDEHMAYIADSKEAVLLANLPYDEQGYLYEATVEAAGQGEMPQHTFFISSSAVDLQNAYLKNYSCFASEAEVDAYGAMTAEMAAAYGITDYQMTWEYEDGSPKQGAAAPEAPLGDGMAEYVIAVKDEAGAPVAGAMIQLCDDATCQVAVTDQDGLVKHTAAPYPFEIHLLKAPDGYAADTATYTMPQEGGELTITLKKQ